MDADRIEKALARIAAAAQRIESAAGRPAAATPADAGALDAQARLAALRSEAETALRDLDRLIEGLAR